MRNRAAALAGSVGLLVGYVIIIAEYSMAEFSISSQTITAKTAVTKLAGEMNNDSFDMLEDEFNNLLESGVLGVVLDISGLDYVTSSGLGALINMSQVLAARKGKLVVAAARPKFVGGLEMLGLEEALILADTAEAAKKMVTSVG